MARQPRIEYRGTFYHVASRGNLRDKIFFKDADRIKLIEILKRTKGRYGYIIHAFHDRYTQITGDDFTVIFYKEPETHDIDLYSVTLSDMVIDASFIIHNFFDSGLLSEIVNLNKEWEEFKNKKMNC